MLNNHMVPITIVLGRRKYYSSAGRCRNRGAVPPEAIDIDAVVIAAEVLTDARVKGPDIARADAGGSRFRIGFGNDRRLISRNWSDDRRSRRSGHRRRRRRSGGRGDSAGQDQHHSFDYIVRRR